jgi:TonB family protein
MPIKGGNNAPNATILPNGSFGSVLPEGEYRVGWSGLPRGFEVKSITSGSTDLLSTNLSVSRVTAALPVVVTLGVDEKPPWVKVSGRVHGVAGLLSTRNLRISLSGQLILDALDVPVLPDGSFEFGRVLPGSYTATFSPPLPVPPTTVTVPNQDMTNFNITVPPLKEVGGVISNHNRPMTVRLTWREPMAVGSGTGTVTASASIPLDGRFVILLPEGERRVTLNVPGYTVQSFTYGAADLTMAPLKISASDTFELRATVTPLASQQSGTGVVGGIVSTIQFVAPPGIPPPPPPPPPPQRVVRIGPDVAKANLISSVPPTYPALANAARVQGVVVLEIQITTSGEVTNIAVLTGHPLLNDAAIQAVRQWRYRPQLLSGQPIAAITTVTVDFTLP